jgi:nicotinamidase/pyrazinamidase
MTALLLVDLQTDFMPGGALPVSEGFEILPCINNLLSKKFDLIVATKDWHPANHCSFAKAHNKKPGERMILNGIEQILWSTHCVQETPGASFSPGWESNKVQHIIHKGTDQNIDSYSAFFDNAHEKSTGLGELLKTNKISTVYIAGLATDYCVKFSALDALNLGFNVYVVKDACKAVNLSLDDGTRALLEMKRAGAHLISSSEFDKN